MKKLALKCKAVLKLSMMLFGMVLLFVHGCANLERPPDLSSPDRFPPEMVEINGQPSQETYMPEQQVKIKFSFRNVYGEPVVLRYPPEIWVLHLDLPGTPEDWIIRSYSAGTEQLVIDKGKTATYEFVWDQKDDSGKLVVPGYYFVEVVERPESTSGKKGNGLNRDFEVFIQYAQGAMEKTIEVNKSQTVSDVPLECEGVKSLTDLTLTLERVDVSEKGAQFCALATLPEYTWKNDNDYFPMNWILCSKGTYAFNGITKDAGCADEEASRDGIRLKWGYINPIDQVPKYIKELTFSVLIRFEDPEGWYGPWEFHVPLE
jgi:hypothetical protein